MPVDLDGGEVLESGAFQAEGLAACTRADLN